MTNRHRPVLRDNMVTTRKMKIWNRSKYRKSIDLNHCEDVTDIGVSALGHGCGQLESINLNRCVRRSQTSVYQHWSMDVVSWSRSISLVVKSLIETSNKFLVFFTNLSFSQKKIIMNQLPQFSASCARNISSSSE
jgi:hypothetical protein